MTEKKTHCYHLPTLSLCSPHIHPGRSSFKEAGSAHFQLGEPRRVTQSHRKGKSRLRRPSHMRWVPNLIPGEPVSPEGAQEGKNTSHLAAPRMQRLPEVSPATAQEAGHKMLVREQRSISKKW